MMHGSDKQLEDEQDGNLAGMLLVAMPSMPDERFARSVVFLCSYDDQGAMGLIINQVNDELAFDTVAKELSLAPDDPTRRADLAAIPVHCGGPVEVGRGFVLHTLDYRHDNSLIINEQYGLTATVEILEAIAEGRGPERMIFALGYAGWSAGQLDGEIQSSGWLLAPADETVIFDLDQDAKWQGALAKLGIHPSALSAASGRA